MTSPLGGDEASTDARRVTVLAIVDDEPTRALLPRVLAGERLIIAADPVRGLAFAESEAPDVVFIDIRIGSGAGLAMVHHLRPWRPTRMCSRCRQKKPWKRARTRSPSEGPGS